jgi:hypothetical protein
MDAPNGVRYPPVDDTSYPLNWPRPYCGLLSPCPLGWRALRLHGGVGLPAVNDFCPISQCVRCERAEGGVAAEGAREQ